MQIKLLLWLCVLLLVDATITEDLKDLYGNVLAYHTSHMVPSEFGSTLSPDELNLMYSKIRSLKVAAYYRASEIFVEKTTQLIAEEVSKEYAASWFEEAQGHILGSLHKVIALQNIVDDPYVSTICETGFNAGYSVLNFLVSNPNATIISFDIFASQYSIYALRTLHAMFPERIINVVAGDSTVSVPNFLSLTGDAMNGKCDVLFVDGGTPEDRRLDVINMHAMANLKAKKREYPPNPNIRLNTESNLFFVASSSDMMAGPGELSIWNTNEYFTNVLIIDDMYINNPNHVRHSRLRQYYDEEFVANGLVETLLQFDVEPTPCISYRDSSQVPDMMEVSVADTPSCIKAWGKSGRPQYNSGIFVKSRYIK